MNIQDKAYVEYLEAKIEKLESDCVKKDKQIQNLQQAKKLSAKRR